MNAADYVKQMDLWQKAKPQRPQHLISEEHDAEGSVVLKAEITNSGVLELSECGGQRLFSSLGGADTIGMNNHYTMAMGCAEALELARWIIHQFRSEN